MSRLRIKQISDFSFTGSLSSGDFLQWNGTNWVNVAGPIDGAKGETGEKGAPGDDGAGGTNRKAALSRVVTLMTAQGFSTDDPTALSIALG